MAATVSNPPSVTDPNAAKRTALEAKKKNVESGYRIATTITLIAIAILFTGGVASSIVGFWIMRTVSFTAPMRMIQFSLGILMFSGVASKLQELLKNKEQCANNIEELNNEHKKLEKKP